MKMMKMMRMTMMMMMMKKKIKMMMTMMMMMTMTMTMKMKMKKMMMKMKMMMTMMKVWVHSVSCSLPLWQLVNSLGLFKSGERCQVRCRDAPVWGGVWSLSSGRHCVHTACCPAALHPVSDGADGWRRATRSSVWLLCPGFNMEVKNLQRVERRRASWKRIHGEALILILRNLPQLHL